MFTRFRWWSVIKTNTLMAAPIQSVQRLSFVHSGIIIMGFSAVCLMWSLSDNSGGNTVMIDAGEHRLIEPSQTRDNEHDQLQRWVEKNEQLLKKHLPSKYAGLTYSPMIKSKYVTRNDVPNRKQKSQKSNNKTTNRAITVDKRHKLILFWSTLYNQPSFMTGSDRFSSCEYSDCEFTNDRKKLKSSAALMFHMWDMKKLEDLPPYRSHAQFWVLFGRESPVNTHVTSEYRKLFNLTQTYRTDADIHLSYGTYVKKDGKQVGQKDYSSGKTKMVAWIVSHCTSESRREEYVDELKKYIQVDIYGKCGFLTCEKESANDCFTMLRTDYKFYLAFENSLCWEYITEKVWNALEYDVVPVVMGYANYSKLLPPKSFIDVRDFKSPKDLAQYLSLLNNNDALYNKYFEWKSDYDVMQNVPHTCELCKYLHTKSETRQFYTEIDSWWNQCTESSVYYTGVYDALT